MRTFEKNIELDAQMVLAGMKYGMEGVMQLGFRLKDIFTTTKMVTDRAKWLKQQDKEYIKQVSNRAAKLEKEGKGKIL